jgi:hypothetical protein
MERRRKGGREEERKGGRERRGNKPGVCLGWVVEVESTVMMVVGTSLNTSGFRVIAICTIQLLTAIMFATNILILSYISHSPWLLPLPRAVGCFLQGVANRSIMDIGSVSQFGIGDIRKGGTVTACTNQISPASLGIAQITFEIHTKRKREPCNYVHTSSFQRKTSSEFP